MATAIPKAYLASSAIRVVTWRRDPTSVCWPSFPPPVPPAGAPFPPRGLVGSIPPLRRYYETLRLLAVHPPRFVAFARRYHPSTCGFAPSDARCCVHGLGLGEPVPAPRRSLRWRRRGLPGSRETHPHACTRSDPGEVAASTASETRRDDLPSNARRRPSHSMHFGAQSRGLRAPCERFAPWVTPGPRITRFRLAAALAGWDWIPTGFRTRFRRSHHGILSPLTGLSRHNALVHGAARQAGQGGLRSRS